MKKVILFALFISLSLAQASRRSENKQARCDERYDKGIQQVIDGSYSRAVTTLSQVRLECIGGIAEPDTLYYFLGEAYLKGKKPAEARLEYRTIVEDYPHSPFREEATYKMALCSYKDAPITERDSRIIRRAMREFNTFISNYPTGVWADSASMYVDSIYNQLIDKELANAEFYEIVKKWDAAIIYYRSILEEYPGNLRTDYIKLQIIKNLVSDHRFTEAQTMIADLADRGIFIDELTVQQKRIADFLAKQERQARRARRRSKAEEDVATAVNAEE